MKKSGDLSIGKVVGVHGLKGVVRIYSHVEDLTLFQEAGQVYIRLPGRQQEKCVVEWIRPHKKQVALAALEGVGSRQEAEAVVGAELFIDSACLPDLEPDTWYWHELIGMKVLTTDGQHLGRLEAIIPTGSNDVYVVRDRTRETLIPALASVVVSVDTESGMMRVNLLEEI